MKFACQDNKLKEDTINRITNFQFLKNWALLRIKTFKIISIIGIFISKIFSRGYSFTIIKPLL
ncbi:MAG: hypothetical protein DI539_17660 [Flavobacterium psychrophilum]|nr:MAG: hypothetical protein DI539_17660 [Flavobacterium psychrophilum]